jgi:hypothetical protein
MGYVRGSLLNVLGAAAGHFAIGSTALILVFGKAKLIEVLVAHLLLGSHLCVAIGDVWSDKHALNFFTCIGVAEQRIIGHLSKNLEDVSQGAVFFNNLIGIYWHNVLPRRIDSRVQ